MISVWKRRRAEHRARKDQRRGEGAAGDEDGGSMEIMIPNHFRCPISLDLMRDPVIISTGITYDRESIEKWIEDGNISCPITNQVVTSLESIPNHTLRKMIQSWCVDNRSHGIERIPTPKIPVSSNEVLEVQERVIRASKRGDRDGCRELVVKVKNLIKESERNKRCFLVNGTSRVLSLAFEEFSKGCLDENVGVLEEILSSLTLMCPLDEEAKGWLGLRVCLDCLVWLLKGSNGDLVQRADAVLILKEVVSSDEKRTKSLLEIEGSMEALFKLVKEPICPQATKASLTIIYNMVAPSSEEIEVITKFGEMGLVPLLIEMLPGAEKSMCEKILGVLDGICSYEQGRNRAYDHALTIPVVIKKVHGVSESATEFSVSILWKLCKGEERQDGRVVIEALRFSAFQKLLLLLQVGCSGKTKEKVSELLKLLNVHRDRLECIESSDFKDLKRNF